jgi:hypothetical protein
MTSMLNIIQPGPNCATCPEASAGTCPAFSLYYTISELGKQGLDMALDDYDVRRLDRIAVKMEDCEGAEGKADFEIRLGGSGSAVASDVMIIERHLSRLRNKVEREITPEYAQRAAIVKQNAVGLYPYPDRLATPEQQRARQILIASGII